MFPKFAISIEDMRKGVSRQFRPVFVIKIFSLLCDPSTDTFVTLTFPDSDIFIV